MGHLDEFHKVDIVSMSNLPSENSGPFYQHRLALTCIYNNMSSYVWYEIPYPFPNFNRYTFEVQEWISNFTPYNIMNTIIFYAMI